MPERHCAIFKNKEVVVKLQGQIWWLLGMIVALPVGTSAQSYRVIDLGSVGNPYYMAVNNYGMVVLNPPNNQAVVWQNWGTTSVGTLGTTAFGAGINDLGQVVGYSYNGSTLRPFIYSNGTISDLGSIPGATESYALSINNAGQVTGYVITGQGGWPSWATLWQNGTVTNLGVNAATLANYGNGINASGTICGDSGSLAFVWTLSGGTQYLPGLPGASTTEAMAISDVGLIVGTSEYTNSVSSMHAVLWNNGTITDLGALAPPGFGVTAIATAINSSTQVVGYSTTASGENAFLYDPVHGMQNLNGLIDTSLGWVLQSALGINDSGVIVGTGTLSGHGTQVFMLLPIPAVGISLTPSNVWVTANSLAGGWIYTLESSTDLVNWTGSPSVVATNPGCMWQDTLQPNESEKFYRLKW